jgi:hypothetical protein
VKLCIHVLYDVVLLKGVPKRVTSMFNKMKPLVFLVFILPLLVKGFTKSQHGILCRNFMD